MNEEKYTWLGFKNCVECNLKKPLSSGRICYLETLFSWNFWFVGLRYLNIFYVMASGGLYSKLIHGSNAWY